MPRHITSTKLFGTWILSKRTNSKLSKSRPYQSTYGLPIDIWELVFEHIYAAGHSLIETSWTCRLFRQVIAPLLYRRVVLLHRTWVPDHHFGRLLSAIPLRRPQKQRETLTWGLQAGSQTPQIATTRVRHLDPVMLLHVRELVFQWLRPFEGDSRLPSVPTIVAGTMRTLKNLRGLHLQSISYDSILVDLFLALPQLEDLTLSTVSFNLEPTTVFSPETVLKLRALRLNRILSTSVDAMKRAMAALVTPHLELFGLENITSPQDLSSDVFAHTMMVLNDVFQPNTVKEFFVWPVPELSKPELLLFLAAQSSIERFVWFPSPLDERRKVVTSQRLPFGTLPRIGTIECPASHLPWVSTCNITQASISCEAIPLSDSLPLILELPGKLERLCIWGLEQFPLQRLSNLAHAFPALKELIVISVVFDISREIYGATSHQILFELWSKNTLESLSQFPSLSIVSISRTTGRGWMPYHTLWSDETDTHSIKWDHVSPSFERIRVFDVEWIRLGQGDWKAYRVHPTSGEASERCLMFPAYVDLNQLGL